MKFCSVLVAVKDMAQSRAFYEGLMGQEVATDFGANLTYKSGMVLQSDFGQLVGFPPGRTRWDAHDLEFYFEADDFEADVQRMKDAGVSLVHDVKEYPWGQRVLRFYDPNGHIVELGEAMRSVVWRFLDQGMTDAEVCARTQHPPAFIQWCKTQR